MAAAYIVQLPAGVGRTLKNGNDAVIVYANSSTEAKAMAKIALNIDADAPWSGATVTAIAAATDWADPVLWKFQVVLSNPATGVEVVNATVTSDSTNDTVDEIAALLVTAIDASGGAAVTPSYNSTSQVLKVAVIADNIGDHALECRAWPVITGGDTGINTGSFFGTIVDEGIAGADVTVTLAADAAVVPLFYSAFKTQ